ncbi:hypothetical protein [Sphingomonas sp. GB1N7]|uniref:hypothetical protein n=1 Tax=Parasphingomonas caseinilytica TaxID=3096158 RepID=UPI002FC78F5C
MVAAGVAEVEFPIVILGEAVMTAVRVERMAALDRQERFAVGHQRADAIDVLTDARADESDDRRLDGAMVRFLRRDFSGGSYALALALADKRARYGAPGNARIIATGCLPCGGRGAIDPVDGFDAKVRRVVAGLDPSVETAPIFAFASVNFCDLADPTRTALTEAQEAGRIAVRAVDRLEQLKDLWRSPDSNEAARPSSRRGWRSAAVLIVTLCAAAAIGALWWSNASRAPLRKCEAALVALEPTKARNDRARIAAAVGWCGEAAKAMPSSGHAMFLAGQAHMLDGGARLASSYWRRAALLGDRNGLAAHGRDLWLAGPETPEAMREALHYLGAAGAKGSAAANEDMAEIYRDGVGVPVDLDRAQTLMKHAEQLRQGEDR